MHKGNEPSLKMSSIPDTKYYLHSLETVCYLYVNTFEVDHQAVDELIEFIDTLDKVESALSTASILYERINHLVEEYDIPYESELFYCFYGHIMGHMSNRIKFLEQSCGYDVTMEIDDILCHYSESYHAYSSS